MAMLAVYEYPHPILKQKAVKVDKVDDELRHFLDDMLETMYESAGVGLAAPQVGVSKRIVVIDAEQEDDGNGHKAGNPMYLVNPEQRAEVERHAQVRVHYLDYDGKEQEILADDFLAIVIQHELDHLDGILYIDRISRLKRQMLLKKLKKHRDNSEG